MKQWVTQKVAYLKNQCLAAARKKVCQESTVQNLEHDFQVLETMVSEPLNYDMEQIPEGPLLDEVCKRLKQKTLDPLSLALLQTYLDPHSD